MKSLYLSLNQFLNYWRPLAHAPFKLIKLHSLIQIYRGEQKQISQSPSGRSIDVVNGDKKSVRVDIADIVSVSACADLTLPPGAGLCIDTVHGPVFLVRIINIHFRVVPYFIDWLLPAVNLFCTIQQLDIIMENFD